MEWRYRLVMALMMIMVMMSGSSTDRVPKTQNNYRGIERYLGDLKFLLNMISQCRETQEEV